MEILSVSNPLGVWLLIVPLLFGTVILIAWMQDCYKKKSKIGLIVLLIITLSMNTFGFIIIKKEIQKEQLKVIIHNMDEVDFDKYKIVSNEGKIITLREK